MAATGVLIRGGLVYDGLGVVGGLRVDVGVQDGTIVDVGPGLAVDRYGRVIDAGGLAVAPGFIDLHSHSDFTFPAFPDSPGQVSQGVTSELIGHCGDTPA